MYNEIMVSVCCLVYNHEKYLRQCLDGFVMQKTNFKFEVLIHDDASADRSADIIREYEAKYPDIIKPIYQTENQYSKGVAISRTYQYPRAKGKYLAICEGDDYWCDDNKLQKQFDKLEQNNDAVFCTHIVRSISESGEKLAEKHPADDNTAEYLSGEAWTQMLLSDKPYQFQTSSYFCRADIIRMHFRQFPEFMQLAKVGDAPLMMLYASYGDLCFINEEMSCYRKNSVGSWSQRFAQNKELRQATITSAIASFRSYDEFTGGKYSALIEKVCIREEYKLLHVNHNYRKMLTQRYRYMYGKESIKGKIYILIFGSCPPLYKIYTRLRGRDE